LFSSAVVVCISLSLGCGGFAWAGFSINHLDIAPQVRQGILSVPGIAGYE